MFYGKTIPTNFSNETTVLLKGKCICGCGGQHKQYENGICSISETFACVRGISGKHISCSRLMVTRDLSQQVLRLVAPGQRTAGDVRTMDI